MLFAVLVVSLSLEQFSYRSNILLKKAHFYYSNININIINNNSSSSSRCAWGTCTHECRCLWCPERGAGVGVIDDCELPEVGAGKRTRVFVIATSHADC